MKILWFTGICYYPLLRLGCCFDADLGIQVHGLPRFQMNQSGFFIRQIQIGVRKPGIRLDAKEVLSDAFRIEHPMLEKARSAE